MEFLYIYLSYAKELFFFVIYLLVYYYKNEKERLYKTFKRIR